MSCPYGYDERIFAPSIKPNLRPDPSIGTRISVYDQEFVWSAEHRAPSELNEWRQRGDPVIDSFFRIYAEQLQDWDDTYEFLHQLANDEHCPERSVTKFSEKIRERPNWFNREEIQRGQQFFLRFSPQAVTSIFHYTLILGYGFQQLNDVLLKTQYLSSSDLFLTFRRLVETFQMIGTSVCGDVDQFDQTFSDVVRVRLLHGMVRYKIQKHQRGGDVPINQEDQLITLLGFSFSVLFCMEERMHIPVSDEDKNAYLHLWRYIGWLIGIEDEFLNYLSSYRSARVISESIFYHFYSPSTISKHMVHHSLMASYLHGQVPLSFQFQIGVSRRLLGEEIARALALDQPEIDRMSNWMISFFLGTLRFGAWLARWNHPRLNEWIIRRNRQRLCFLVYSALGDQLCNFALFKSYRTATATSTNVRPLKECLCQFYQKKHSGTVQTNDFGPIRCRKPFSVVPLVEQSICLLLLVLLVRCCSSVLL